MPPRLPAAPLPVTGSLPNTGNPATLYLASLGSTDSRRVMASRLRSVARALGKQHVRELEWNLMDRQWLIATQEALRAHPPSHVNAIFSLLKGIALQAWRLRIISADAYLRVKTTRSLRASKQPNRRRLGREEVFRLIDDCVMDERKQGLRDAALLSILYGCGLRRAELVGIDVEHVDHAEGSVLIRGKRNKERLLYPPARAWGLLNEWVRESGKTSGPVFCRVRKGGLITADRLTGQAVYFLINKFIARANIERFTPHDLRGSFISFLLDTGHDIKTVSDIVGHAYIQTTAGYDRRGEQRKKKANHAIRL